MDSRVNSLYRYVTESTRTLRRNGKTIQEDIEDLLTDQPSLKTEMVLYRGQLGSLEGSDEISPMTWFSTTKNKLEAEKHKQKECCLFTIYVQPGIKVLNVYKILSASGIVTSFEEEEEYIVSGGGVFYEDKEKTRTGFAQIKPGEYVTYYFPSTPTQNKKNVTAERLLKRMEGMEQYYNTRNDILSLLEKNEQVSDSEVNKILETIEQILAN